MEQKLTGFAANQEIPRILWNPNVHYRTHKRLPNELELWTLKHFAFMPDLSNWYFLIEWKIAVYISLSIIPIKLG